MSTFFPSRFKKLAKANSEPTVSPSGPMCPDKKKVVPFRTALKMSSMILFLFRGSSTADIWLAGSRLFGGSFLRGRFFAVNFFQYFKNAGGFFRRFIINENKLRAA